MDYFAHSENDNKVKHRLAKHLHETARLAESFASCEEYKPLFKLSGLLHDLGKYQPEFQHYLENGGRRGSVPHASWGAGYAGKLKNSYASIAIDGHHKGLPDRAAWKSDINPYLHDDVTGFDEIVNKFFSDADLDATSLTVQQPLQFDTNGFQQELFIRYLFSALTDSDWLSTEEHFAPDKTALRTDRQLPIDFMLGKLEEAFAAKSKAGEINELRNQARNWAIEKALLTTGCYSLALPTGMGKTLTSLAWALRHAKQNHLKRIIIVLPYISIIDQTAKELKKIFGNELILEHHSTYNEAQKATTDKNEDYLTEQKRKHLACENWDYPVIVTTTVQFFESLFSNKPSKCRKVHSIAESVVIFDEVQTIPKEIVLPTLGMLNDVRAVMRTSFLFCTATQPAYEKRLGFDGITSITPLIEDPGILYDKTKRVTYNLLDDLAPVSYSRLADAVIEHDQSALVIFNTKKDALEFFNLMKSGEKWDAKYHLSTAMCPDHRKRTISRIKANLEAKKKILVVSTQLIEAGVDFDFPLVFRALAPLEAIIQSAGRCNREGKMDGFGNVFLFILQDASYPNKTYKACAGYAAELLQNNIDQLYSHNVFEKYYASVFALYIDQTRQQGINNARKEFNFETVNDSYRYLDDHSEGLFIYNYSDESRQLLHSMQYKEFLSRDDYRAMQPFTVQAYENFIFQNREDVKMSPHGFKIWYGNYDPDTGISVAPMEVDKYVV